jgi:hypothetical protein
MLDSLYLIFSLPRLLIVFCLKETFYSPVCLYFNAVLLQVVTDFVEWFREVHYQAISLFHFISIIGDTIMYHY